MEINVQEHISIIIHKSVNEFSGLIGTERYKLFDDEILQHRVIVFPYKFCEFNFLVFKVDCVNIMHIFK